MRKEFKNKMTFGPLPVCVIGTYDKNKHANAMIAAWATIYDFGQVFVVVDLSHKTAANLKESKAFTLAFATKDTCNIADYLGMVSGNTEPNKVEKAKLTIVDSKNVNAPIFEQFPLTLECEVISFDEGNLIGKIVATNVDDSYVDSQGKIKSIDFVTYDMPTDSYRVVGDKIAKPFRIKKI